MPAGVSPASCQASVMLPPSSAAFREAEDRDLQLWSVLPPLSCRPEALAARQPPMPTLLQELLRARLREAALKEMSRAGLEREVSCCSTKPSQVFSGFS